MTPCDQCNSPGEFRIKRYSIRAENSPNRVMQVLIWVRVGVGFLFSRRQTLCRTCLERHLILNPNATLQRYLDSDVRNYLDSGS